MDAVAAGEIEAAVARNDAVVAVNSRDGGERHAGVAAQYRYTGLVLECDVCMAAHRRPVAAVASRNVRQLLLPCLLARRLESSRRLVPNFPYLQKKRLLRRNDLTKTSCSSSSFFRRVAARSLVEYPNLHFAPSPVSSSVLPGSHPLADASAVLGFERSQLPPRPCLLLSVCGRGRAVMASGSAASAASASAGAGATAGAGKDDELADLVRRFIDALSRYSDRLPFDLDRQKLRSLTTLAAITVTLIFAWKLLRAPQEQPQRPRRRVASSPSNTSSRSWPGALTSTDACSSSADSRAQEAINQLFQPANLTLEQLVRHKLSEGRRVTCRLLGVILEETTPEELQNHVTVRPSVLEVLLEIAKFCDVYLMERILDDESGEKVLSALSEAGLFTCGGLIKDKVLFCSKENGRVSFVRQIEPDWHIDTSPDIVHQLAVSLSYRNLVSYF
ncbi:hypothetical protein GUJ93_ZPchr0458g22859 [Zizania palustris]|uniref:Peroxisome biogenesis protein 22 n=1 Tax=Zizania palustris TaxID=103762 RepID=A0A8J5RCV3_ZIZPA|nr:hypothetical protein GUJ93_ZPchr0458g22859 [Zizania palustris]